MCALNSFKLYFMIKYYRYIIMSNKCKHIKILNKIKISLKTEALKKITTKSTTHFFHMNTFSSYP